MGFGNPFKGLEKDIKKGLNKLGDSIKSGIKSVGREVESNVKSVGNKAKGAIESAADKAEDTIKDIAQDAEESVEKAAKTSIEEIEDFAEDALEEAQAAATKAAQAALAEISAGALNKVVDAMQVLMPSSSSLSLGPFVLSIDDWTDRIDTLQKWASKPPSTKNDIRKIIEEIAPSSVSINLSFSLAFLVVQTDSLEFGVESTYETADFLDKFEELLAHYGINI